MSIRLYDTAFRRHTILVRRKLDVLSELWTGGKVRELRLEVSSSTPRTDTYREIIFIPYYMTTFGAKNTPEAHARAWRKLKYALWHECMHVVMTELKPINVVTEYSQVRTNIVMFTTNMFEDYRVDLLGTETYRGMRELVRDMWDTAVKSLDDTQAFCGAPREHGPTDLLTVLLPIVYYMLTGVALPGTDTELGDELKKLDVRDPEFARMATRMFLGKYTFTQIANYNDGLNPVNELVEAEKLHVGEKELKEVEELAEASMKLQFAVDSNGDIYDSGLKEDMNAVNRIADELLQLRNRMSRRDEQTPAGVEIDIERYIERKHFDIPTDIYNRAKKSGFNGRVLLLFDTSASMDDRRSHIAFLTIAVALHRAELRFSVSTFAQIAPPLCDTFGMRDISLVKNVLRGIRFFGYTPLFDSMLVLARSEHARPGDLLIAVTDGADNEAMLGLTRSLFHDNEIAPDIFDAVRYDSESRYERMAYYCSMRGIAYHLIDISKSGKAYEFLQNSENYTRCDIGELHKYIIRRVFRDVSAL